VKRFQDRRFQPLTHSSVFDSNVFRKSATSSQTLRYPLHRQFLALFRAVEKMPGFRDIQKERHNEPSMALPKDLEQNFPANA
jgi:hypothetical protein